MRCHGAVLCGVVQCGLAAIDLAGTSATIKVDIDGESRPFGVANDIGADELH